MQRDEEQKILDFEIPKCFNLTKKKKMELDCMPIVLSQASY